MGEAEIAAVKAEADAAAVPNEDPEGYTGVDDLLLENYPKMRERWKANLRLAREMDAERMMDYDSEEDEIRSTSVYEPDFGDDVDANDQIFVQMQKPRNDELEKLRSVEGALTKKQLDRLDELGKEQEAFPVAPPNVVNRGLTFNLRYCDSIMQLHKISKPGKYKLRISLTQPKGHCWNPGHQLFVGISYGTNWDLGHSLRERNLCGPHGSYYQKYQKNVNRRSTFFGYLCKQSDFLGIFSLSALAGPSFKVDEPIHLTGSAGKMQFDLDLDVSMTKVNQIVTNVMQVTSETMDINRAHTFECSLRTLIHPEEGLRFVLVPLGLAVPDEIEVALNWVN